MKKDRAATVPAAGPNPAYVAKMQALRSSGAAGIHKQARRPVRGQSKRAAIRDSAGW